MKRRRLHVENDGVKRQDDWVATANIVRQLWSTDAKYCTRFVAATKALLVDMRVKSELLAHFPKTTLFASTLWACSWLQDFTREQQLQIVDFAQTHMQVIQSTKPFDHVHQETWRNLVLISTTQDLSVCTSAWLAGQPFSGLTLSLNYEEYLTDSDTPYYRSLATFDERHEGRLWYMSHEIGSHKINFHFDREFMTEIRNSLKLPGWMTNRMFLYAMSQFVGSANELLSEFYPRIRYDMTERPTYPDGKLQLVYPECVVDDDPELIRYAIQLAIGQAIPPVLIPSVLCYLANNKTHYSIDLDQW
jgi:hypothetical protein